jgi:hypothetical protein
VTSRRWVMALLAGSLMVLVSAAPAAADPPGPTDYQSSIAAVVPAVAGVEATMIGGDAFLQIEVDPGIQVVVLGYRGEPYVQFLPDGTVEENRASPSTYLNEDRYAETEIPDGASYDAEPQWEVVATNGRWAWHDHRTHWMNPARPLGSEPGDQILEAVVPLIVDGENVSITVVSVWQKAPSPLAGIAGTVIGLAILIGLVAWLGLGRGATVAIAATALVALGMGWWQVTSVPNETGPSALLYLLPAAALVLSGAGLLLWQDRMATLGFVAAVPLAMWGLVKRDGIVRAIIPTDAPLPLDRAVTAVALVVGVGAALVLFWVVSRGNAADLATRRATEEPAG